MKNKINDSICGLKYIFVEKLTLFFSIGSLILNLLIFALVMREAWMMSLILAGIFLIYIPIGYYEKQEQLWEVCSRILEILLSLSLSFAYILLFGKFWLLFLPIAEVAAVVLYYAYVYESEDEDYGVKPRSRY